jgi:hypothetical protein
MLLLWEDRGTTENARMQQLLPLPAPEPAQRVVRIEKNLNSLGFFSPATKAKQTKKVISITREVEGMKVEARATIIGHHDNGLPTTADLDKYLAFQLIVAELKKKSGHIVNPVGFTTYQLLKVLGQTPSGKNYRDVEEWLDRMSATWIKSEGAVYFAKTKRYAKDRFHVFDRVVTAGQDVDGTVADRNYVWLSSWQLENLNHNYVLPIDLGDYQKLKSPIAKALVPLLYVWFYASTKSVQKRYTDLCQLLSIRSYPQISRANEKLSPGMNELAEVGYLSEWQLVRTIDKTDFKVMMARGTIFEKQASGNVFPCRSDKVADPRFHSIVALLTERGVVEKIARRLMLDVPEGQQVEDQIEWIDSIIGQGRGRITNAPGLYVDYIRAGVKPPPGFVSIRRGQKSSEAGTGTAQERITRQNERLDIETRYAEYREQNLRTYINNLRADAREDLMKRCRKKASGQVRQWATLPVETQNDLTLRLAMTEVEAEANLMPPDEFPVGRQVELNLAGSA